MEAGKTTNQAVAAGIRFKRVSASMFALVFLLVLIRTGFLYTADFPPAAGSLNLSAPEKRLPAVYAETQASFPDEIPADLALLSAICPQGYQYAELNKQESPVRLAPPYRETASRTPAEKAWLVPRSEWFVAEDGASPQESQIDAVAEPAQEEPPAAWSKPQPAEVANPEKSPEIQSADVDEPSSSQESNSTEEMAPSPEALVDAQSIEVVDETSKAAKEPELPADPSVEEPQLSTDFGQKALPSTESSVRHGANQDQGSLPLSTAPSNAAAMPADGRAKITADPKISNPAVPPSSLPKTAEPVVETWQAAEAWQQDKQLPLPEALSPAEQPKTRAKPGNLKPDSFRQSTSKGLLSETSEIEPAQEPEKQLEMAPEVLPAPSGSKPANRALGEDTQAPSVQSAESLLAEPQADAADTAGMSGGEKAKAPPTSLFAPPAVRPATPSAPATPSNPATNPALGSPHSASATAAKTPKTPAEAAKTQREANEAHRDLFAKNCYPSARECGKCHKKVYEEWSISSHAYAFMSPMYHRFEQKISEVSQGTVGYFCQRCHSPVGTAMNVSRDTPLWEMAEVAREGVTCIACHRINQVYGKTNGERRVVPGDIHAPVYGGIGGDGVAKAIADKATYKVKTSPNEKGAGQPIHNEGRFFQHLGASEFCTSCHQVAVQPGIKLEVVWEQYRASPACKKGITCQSCHMGTKPGVPSPYEVGPIADLAGGKHVNKERLHANHTFYGPGYSIAHPGIFPQHEKGNRWTIPEWLSFDWRAGWGTDDFEDAVADGKVVAHFPEIWKESDDRFDAREIIEDNLEKLKHKRELRSQVMENGSQVSGPFFKKPPCRGQELKFDYVVTNLNEGHNLPTASLGAQPQLWANVVLIGPSGQRLWETGYTDSYGDLADIHSEDVRHGRLPFDWQLFNLQTMFLITGATGTDREFFLPVNIDIDQVAQLRPGAIPVTVTNHPPFIRMESRSLPPLGSKRVKYRVPAKLITQPGTYRLSFRMRSRTEPIYFMRFCDSTTEMQRSMNEGILDFHTYSVEFQVR